METIYLVGQISIDKPITYKWREETVSSLSGRDFNVINPCDNEFNTGINGIGDGTGELPTEIFGNDEVKLFVPKDLHYVKQSSGCIVNMNRYDHNRPFIGSFYELAWYYTMPEKFVIGVFDGDRTKDRLCNHPFVRESVHVWCKDHMTAVKIIEKYFRRYS